MANLGGRTSTNTKPWNTKMDRVDADEQIYTDYKDDKHTQVTNIKFKTTPDRIDAWITAHKEHFPEPDLWDHKPSCATLRIKDSEHGNLTVKFHKTTGVVLIQGAMHKYWKDQYYIKLQRRVSQLRLSPGSADSHCKVFRGHPAIPPWSISFLILPFSRDKF